MLKTISEQNLSIKMDVETEFEEHRFQTFFTKEPETIDWIKTLVQPGDVFYDIGANVGVYTLYAVALHGAELKVLAFEPAYHNFAKLCRNIAFNNLQDHVTPYCIALSDKTEFEHFDLASTVSGSASHAMENPSKFLAKNFVSQFRQGIFCATLDEAIMNFDLPFPNHIKIDVDGFEERVLHGGKKIVRGTALKSVLVEITDFAGSKSRIIQFMEEAGFHNDHPLNFAENHSRLRRQQAGKGHIENIIFTRL